MILTSLRINQLSPAASAWYLGVYLAAMDRRDIDAYAALLADGVTVRFNNEEPVAGKPAVVGMLGGYWQGFAAIEHEPLNIYGSDRAFMLEALNHYTRHDGKKVTARAVALTDRDPAGAVTSVRVYSDVSALFRQDELAG